MDDFYEGWNGLTRGVAERLLDSLIRPLTRGRSTHVATWDWHASAWGLEIKIAPRPLIVLEGDGEAFAAYRESWATQERDLFALEHTRDRRPPVYRQPRQPALTGRHGTLLVFPHPRRRP